METKRILRNRAQCRNCEEVIESHHRNDFVVCGCYKNSPDCQGIFVDGGTAYLRRGGALQNIIELSEFEED
jgi:hypothetical protein